MRAFKIQTTGATLSDLQLRKIIWSWVDGVGRLKRGMANEEAITTIYMR
jgi:hypothetical protein